MPLRVSYFASIMSIVIGILIRSEAVGFSLIRVGNSLRRNEAGESFYRDLGVCLIAAGICGLILCCYHSKVIKPLKDRLNSLQAEQENLQT